MEAIIDSKLMALKQLVEEQIDLAYLESSTSRHNNPIFIALKKLSHYRLLKDLHDINDQMENMGSTQPGLPHTGAFPPSHHIDIKDCFFQISPTTPDRYHFAFMIWEPNMHKPLQRYQWIVLPWSMKNNPIVY